MLFAFLDELGHSGRFVSRGHAQYNASPIFGFGGFVIDSEKLRPFASEVIGLKAQFLSANRDRAVRREVKAKEIFEPGLFTASKPAHARRRINLLALTTLDRLRFHGGRTCYYGVEKKDEFPIGKSHDEAVLERTCLREVVELVKKEVHRLDTPCLIVVDYHNTHHRKSGIIAYSMAADGYFKQLMEPPMMGDSKLSTSIQVADWISGLVNKIFIPKCRQGHEWPELGPYETKFSNLLTANALPRSRIELRAPATPAAPVAPPGPAPAV